MAEIIVEAARDLYTDEEWEEIAQECVTRCRDCIHHAKKYGKHGCFLRINQLGKAELVNPDWFCSHGKPKSEPVHKTHKSQRDSFHELIGWD